MESYVPKLKLMERDVIENMVKKYDYKSRFQVPMLKSIVISCAHNAAKEDTKFLDEAMEQIARISSQKPVRTKSRKAISNFKIKEDQPIGCRVTLRREKMWEFLDRLVNIAIPRMRDFRGLDRKSFDRDGNYNLGIPDIAVFPEVQVRKVTKAIGVGVSFCMKTSSIDEAVTFLGMLGVPFKKNG
ncbi:MAG: 50S ribosomal protein L5 [Planctomycetota bacterium]